jgi:GNAT superfamily N-acetyltransferase
VSAYRFCRTDDIALLVDALNCCWRPYYPDEPPMTPATFKRSIRDLQVWCSSCMVAFSGADPIGVLIGAKRPAGTLIHKIAVHPSHRRQGHARHLLDSLSAKLAILGPPRIVAEVPVALTSAGALFSTSGYVEEAILTDYVWSPDGGAAREIGSSAAPGPDRFLVPVTIDDLVANGLLDESRSPTCWERSADALMARKADIAGLAIASDERLEACVLYTSAGELVSLRSFVEDDGARLAQLLARLPAIGARTFSFSKVHPAEMSSVCLHTLGFRAVGRHRLYASVAGAGAAVRSPSTERSS